MAEKKTFEDPPPESAWLARVAHEARNPLFGISASCRALRDALADGADAAPALERIEAETKRLKALLDDLLELGRPAPTTPVKRSLAVLLSSAVAAARARHALARKIVLEVGPNVPDVLVDEVRVAQVFGNLLDNALLAGEDVTVRVSASCGAEGTRVDVSDDGPGFTDEARRRAFEPFYSTRAGGTGLGLFVARHTMEAHGGSLRLLEGEGRGATIRVVFPEA